MSFSWKKQMTLDASQAGSTDSTNWTLTVGPGVGPQSVDADFKTVSNGGFVQNANGYDIRPYSDSALTTPLTYELVFYNAVTGAFEMHVNIPTLSHTTNVVIYMAFGDATISTDGSSTSTWNSNYKAVWHFKDLGGGIFSGLDSTSNANDFDTSHSGGTVTTGQIDGAALLSSSTFLENNTGTTAASDNVTVTGWFKFSNLDNYAIVRGDDAHGNGWSIFIKGTTAGISVSCVMVATGPAGYTTTGTTAMTTGVWYKMTVFIDQIGGTIKASLNGVPEASLSLGGNTSLRTSTQGYEPGHDIAGNTGANSFAQANDEIKVSNVVRSADWDLAEYNAEKTSSTFITWGAKIPASNAPSITGISSITGIQSITF